MDNISTQRRHNTSSQPGGGGPHTEAHSPTIDKASLQKIIAEGDVETLVKQAQSFAPRLTDFPKEGDRLTTSQIRAVFGEVRQIEGQWSVNPEKAARRLYLVKPKLAYRKKKENKPGVSALVDVLDPALDLVYQVKDKDEQKIRFSRFVDLFEAILAYHKGK